MKKTIVLFLFYPLCYAYSESEVKVYAYQCIQKNSGFTSNVNKSLIEACEISASNGHPSSAAHLGYMYLAGSDGLEKSPTIGRKYLELAVKNPKLDIANKVIANNILAGMYRDGKGGTTNTKTACRLYNDSAAAIKFAHYFSTYFALATMYYYGKGCTQNYKLSYFWASLAIAASKTDKDATTLNINSRITAAQAMNLLKEYSAEHITTKEIEVLRKKIANWNQTKNIVLL